MSPPTCKICTQMPVPDDRQALADMLAVQENPLNGAQVTSGTQIQGGGPPESLALPIGSMWANGRVLRVRILNGSDKVKQKIRQYAVTWTQFANITLNFVDAGDAEIRVNVDASNRSWSNLGTRCLATPANEQTMNFGWLTDDTDEEEFSRVITHEFGHALGCIHEHQSPAGGIQWNREAVYAYYADTLGWNRARVDVNLFQLYAANTTQFSAFDPSSIMLYAIPADLTTNGFTVGWNNVLSATDRAFIAQAYPRAPEPARGLVSGTFNTMEVRQWDQPAPAARKTVTFATPFNTPPAIAVGLNWLDIGYSDDVRIIAYADNVTAGNMRLSIESWENTKIYSAGCVWYAPPVNGDIQTGHFGTEDDHAWNAPKPRTTRRITFARPYAAPPKVIAWLDKLGLPKDKTYRVSATVENITVTGFTLNINTWSDSVVYMAGASWIAHPADMAGVVSGTYHTNDVNSSSTADLLNGGRVDFPAGKFQRNPTVLLALNAIDSGNGRNLRANLSADSISPTGMNWHIDAWVDSLLYGAGASYIAFA